MWSRRPLRRAIRPPLRQILGPRAIPPMLLQANRLFQDGIFDQAAMLYVNLAKGAEARNGPRAPRFYLQAGRSFLYAKNIAASKVNTLHGLDLLIAQGNSIEVSNISTRLISEYGTRGYEEAANEIKAWLESRNIIADQAPRVNSEEERQNKILPVRCPNCGAPVRSDEITWIDELTAECNFCGGMIRLEESNVQ